MAVPLSPPQLLFDMSTMHVVARALHVVANIGIADVLGDQPMTAEALARKMDAHPEALDRVLRLMTNYGVFAFEEGRYRHSPASRLLRSDNPNSMRAWVRMMGMPLNWSSYGLLEHAVRTGTPARRQVASGDFFTDYLPQHPEEARLFDEAMSANSAERVQAILKAYDFSRFRTIADIGGGRGHLIRGILDATPSARGILFDLPHAVDPIRALDVPRLTIVEGDFFRTPLPAADAYVLKAVIHDWCDDDARRILNAVRNAAPNDGKLLLVERILTDNGAPDPGRRMDIHMLAAHSGRERTRGQFEALAALARFRVERVLPTWPGAGIVECAAA